MAPFVHEVAVESLLVAQEDLLAKPDLDARLKHVVIGKKIAGAAGALINVPASEVVPIDILPVPTFVHLIDADLTQVTIHEFLCVGNSLLESL